MTTPATIDADPGGTIADLPTTALLEHLAEQGSVWLRGFNTGDADFDALCNRLCDRYTCDPGKVITGGLRGHSTNVGRAARVASRAAARAMRRPLGDDTGRTRYAPFGGFGINPHSENSFLPLASPDLVAFLCLRPASDGGDSLLADGVEALQRLDDEVETFLRSTPIRYESTLSEPQWRSVWGVDDLDQLVTTLANVDGVSSVTAEKRNITVVYDRVQIASTRFGGHQTIRTNLLSRHPFGGIGRDHRERSADGHTIDRELLESLLESTRPHESVRLGAGDILLIDNTRVMHGRTPFTDVERRVVTRCGWLAQAGSMSGRPNKNP